LKCTVDAQITLIHQVAFIHQNTETDEIYNNELRPSMIMRQWAK